MGREFELKFRTTEVIQDAIASAFEGFRQIRMETTYFDTPDGALSDRHITLRLRRENDTTVCTVKTPSPNGGRGEWECEATDITAGLNQLVALGAPLQIAVLATGGLEPVCGAKFTRLAIQVPTADGTAELALDRGILLGGGREIPLCEVEVELKTGSDQAAVALARALAAQYGLEPENRSKFRRARALAKGEDHG